MIEYGMFEYRESMGDAIYTRSGIYRVEYRRGCIYASLNIRGVDICNAQGGRMQRDKVCIYVGLI